MIIIIHYISIILIFGEDTRKKKLMISLLLSEDHSPYYYLLLLVLLLGHAQSLGIGALFFLKRSGDKRSNAAMGMLLISFSLTLLHYIFIYTGIYDRYPNLHYLPLYFTLSFPVLLFYHVKLSLFPVYQLRWTDLKHVILPLGPVLFFLVNFIRGKHFGPDYGRWFSNPFYGAFEQLLYLFFSFAYLYFAYRYIQKKRATQPKNRTVRKKIWYAALLVRIFLLLFSVHTLFILADYISYNLLQIDLRANNFFAALGILSFVALIYWLGVYGFQVLFWGRKMFTTK